MESWNAQMMMDKYIYNYLIAKGFHTTAEIFAAEANVINPKNVVIESPEGFLMEWWDGFYDIHNTYHAENAQESYTEAHNISPVESAFKLTTPEDDLNSDLSRPMEQIPSMPQQMDNKDEGEVSLKRTMQLEPNPSTLKKIKLSVPEPSEAGCSTGSYSGMQQTP